MTCKRTLAIGRFCLLLTIASLILPSAGMADSLAEHHIKISFDLGEHKIFGTVDAIFPRSVKAVTVGRGLRITKFLINGKNGTPKIIDNRLALPPHREAIKIQMEYEGIFSNKEGGNLENIIGDEGAFLLSDWYPAGETELARFSLQAIIPKDFQAVSEADDITTEDMGSNKLIRFDFSHPVANIHFIMASYLIEKDHQGGVKVETYLLPDDQNLARRYLDASKKYLEMYEKMLGPYPFKRFAVVENILPTGYGMPTFTLLGRQVLKLPFIPETSLGHEILHSWFGNSVYVDYSKGNWSEGLTTYLADQYYAQMRGDGWQYRKGLIEDYESYVHGKNEIAIQDFISGDNRALRAVGYGKTAMFFHMLNNRVGERVFTESLRELVVKDRFRLTSWRNIEAIFSEKAAKDLRWFFEFWLEHKGAMEIRADKIRLTQSSDGYVLEFTMGVKNSPMPVFIPLVIHSQDKEEKKILSLSKERQSFSLPIKDVAREIVVDPDYDLFRTLSPTERRAVLSRLLGDPTRSVVLPEKNQEIYEPLIQELDNRGFKKLTAQEVDHKILAHRSLLFLGDHPKYEFILPRTAEKASGFSLVITKNKFNPNLVVGLAVGEDSEEVQGVINKLFHYGKYSKLVFSGGRNVVKETEKSERGIQLEVGAPVRGIPTTSILSVPEIVSRVADKTIVYVGEKHDQYGDHLLQLEMVRDLHRRYPKLAIGMEMFQRRYQNALDEYISGAVNTQTFLKKSHYLDTWRFNYHLYEDILQYAREQKIPVIALNQENELVSKVATQGLAKLTPEEKAHIPAEMDLNDKAYKERLQGVFEMHQSDFPGDTALQDFEYFYEAQILWDETMAETIANFLKDRPAFHLVVLAGSGHLAYGSGIPKRAYRRIAKDYTIVLPDPGELPNPGMADFIVFPNKLEAPEEAKLGVVLDTSGERFEVVDLVMGGGAQKAGVKKGDILVAVNHIKVNDLDDIRTCLATKYVGDTVEIQVLRDEEVLEFEVELGSSRP
ncbi:MAG: ChaN family lipoprotein [Deltaproteobacteria bacterium]|nr:ChaN family lipoprotein [Deltaproteobacteria bacterium]